VGFSHSREKFFYLPGQIPFTDSIYAIIGEELGIIACLTILALFLWLGWRGLSIAAASKDRFISLTAAGMTSVIMIGAAINILVNLDLMPLTGLPLPFISYGGSSLLFSLIAIGIVAGISRQLPRLAGSEEAAPAAKFAPPASAAGGSGQEKMRSRSLRPRGL
jgi:cell division protein FtsW